MNRKDYYTRFRYLKQNKILTCVIGARCADGCVIVSDTRMMREFEATNESKIHLLWNKAAMAGAGTTALLDKLAESISKSEISSIPDFQKVVETIEDMVFNLRRRYEPRMGQDYNFQAVVMGLKEFNKGDPYIRLVHAEGISEDIKEFAIIGHGATYVAAFFKLLYDNMLNVNELAVLGYFAIASLVLLGLDQTVGMSPLGPEAVILKTNEEPKFLNPLEGSFVTARTSLEHLQFRYKLVRSIWSQLPQAFENIDPNLL